MIYSLPLGIFTCLLLNLRILGFSSIFLLLIYTLFSLCQSIYPCDCCPFKFIQSCYSPAYYLRVFPCALDRNIYSAIIGYCLGSPEGHQFSVCSLHSGWQKLKCLPAMCELWELFCLEHSNNFSLHSLVKFNAVHTQISVHPKTERGTLYRFEEDFLCLAFSFLVNLPTNSSYLSLLVFLSQFLQLSKILVLVWAFSASSKFQKLTPNNQCIYKAHIILFKLSRKPVPS